MEQATRDIFDRYDAKLAQVIEAKGVPDETATEIASAILSVPDGEERKSIAYLFRHEINSKSPGTRNILPVARALAEIGRAQAPVYCHFLYLEGAMNNDASRAEDLPALVEAVSTNLHGMPHSGPINPLYQEFLFAGHEKRFLTIAVLTRLLEKFGAIGRGDMSPIPAFEVLNYAARRGLTDGDTIAGLAGSLLSVLALTPAIKAGFCTAMKSIADESRGKPESFSRFTALLSGLYAAQGEALPGPVPYGLGATWWGNEDSRAFNAMARGFMAMAESPPNRAVFEESFIQYMEGCETGRNDSRQSARAVMDAMVDSGITNPKSFTTAGAVMSGLRIGRIGFSSIPRLAVISSPSYIDILSGDGDPKSPDLSGKLERIHPELPAFLIEIKAGKSTGPEIRSLLKTVAIHSSDEYSAVEKLITATRHLGLKGTRIRGYAEFWRKHYHEREERYFPAIAARNSVAKMERGGDPCNCLVCTLPERINGLADDLATAGFEPMNTIDGLLHKGGHIYMTVLYIAYMKALIKLGLNPADFPRVLSKGGLDPDEYDSFLSIAGANLENIKPGVRVLLSLGRCISLTSGGVNRLRSRIISDRGGDKIKLETIALAFSSAGKGVPVRDTGDALALLLTNPSHKGQNIADFLGMVKNLRGTNANRDDFNSSLQKHLKEEDKKGNGADTIWKTLHSAAISDRDAILCLAVLFNTFSCEPMGEETAGCRIEQAPPGSTPFPWISLLYSAPTAGALTSLLSKVFDPQGNPLLPDWYARQVEAATGIPRDQWPQLVPPMGPQWLVHFPECISWEQEMPAWTLAMASLQATYGLGNPGYDWNFNRFYDDIYHSNSMTLEWLIGEEPPYIWLGIVLPLLVYSAWISREAEAGPEIMDKACRIASYLTGDVRLKKSRDKMHSALLVAMESGVMDPVELDQVLEQAWIFGGADKEAEILAGEYSEANLEIHNPRQTAALMSAIHARGVFPMNELVVELWKAGGEVRHETNLP